MFLAGLGIDPFLGLPEKYSSDVKIRKAKKTDMPAVEVLTELLFPDADVKRKEDDAYLVAEKKDAIVGFCHFRIREKTCYVLGLGVLPDFRKHGIGSMLMAETLRIADREGILTTMLKVRALNTAANLYARFGFFEKRSGAVLLLVRKLPS